MTKLMHSIDIMHEFNHVLTRVTLDLSIYKALRLSFQHAVFLAQLVNTLIWALFLLEPHHSDFLTIPRKTNLRFYLVSPESTEK